MKVDFGKSLKQELLLCPSVVKTVKGKHN